MLRTKLSKKEIGETRWILKDGSVTTFDAMSRRKLKQEYNRVKQNKLKGRNKIAGWERYEDLFNDFLYYTSIKYSEEITVFTKVWRWIKSLF